MSPDAERPPGPDKAGGRPQRLERRPESSSARDRWLDYRVEEAMAEAGASWAIAEARQALADFDGGEATIGWTLARLGAAGAEADLVRIARGWGFLEDSST